MTEEALNLPGFVTNHINVGVIIIDDKRNIRFWNRFMETRSHKDAEQVMGKNLFEIFPELPERWLDRKIQGVFAMDTPAFSNWEQRHHLFDLPHTRPFTTSSRYMAQNVSIIPIENEELNVDLVCITIEDATDVYYFQTQYQATMEQLELANRTDGLTKVFNRRYWEEQFTMEFNRAMRYGTDLSLVMFDLDKFKNINDTYGHQGGDLVLVEVCAFIMDLLRDTDLIGRYGGEEFGIIFPNTDSDGALQVCERIRQGFQLHKMVFDNQTIWATMSMGLVSLDPEHKSIEDMINRADLALYQSKRDGRNQVTVYHS